MAMASYHRCMAGCGGTVKMQWQDTVHGRLWRDSRHVALHFIHPTLPAISALVPHQPSVGKAMLTLYDLGERISLV